ncbi:glycogen/starch/alpha-glucan phosphorylase [Exiguobacterium sp. Helios]|uniref:glycogen/starch/alpha-glucan phosphorylase n=1 Tax=Exiguobacterium sp. Helios TaxID=2735868 RepID=UPI00165DF8F7|nr:glycogen/starch/alpha-glucan phosphorylase [Exiguobacterium sp. Helios]QNR20304.1 glycogen/starch/alpha-glucan phosphorylase [Exiguobacterium sp. Helios]
MFQDKEKFKKRFNERFISMHGKALDDATENDVYQTLAYMVREYVTTDWMRTKEAYIHKKSKQVYYFSLEFLLGRFLYNNLLSLDVLEEVRSGLSELGYDLADLTEEEPEPGLGNGGLGRLAACFLDSLAALGLPGHGNGIRYQYGLFKQKIIDGYQVELPDNWLKNGNMWEIRRSDKAVDIPFGGNVWLEEVKGGKYRVHHEPAEIVRAVPYDMPIVGYQNGIVNNLRLWSAESPYDDDELLSQHRGNYKDLLSHKQAIQTISEFLYPDDTTYEGKVLRLKQQYFFVSAGLRSILLSHKKRNTSLKHLGNQIAIHINDTHPVVAIPELMRILIDEEEYSWEESWRITKSVMSFTNHTLLSEALERWPVDLFRNLLPRIYLIVEEINRRFCKDVLDNYPHLEANMREIAIIADGMINMANLAVVGTHSTNGVAQIHTEILKQREMRLFYEMFPLRFNNKTNGITHRRWFLLSNPALANRVTEAIGDSWINHPSDLQKLTKFAEDTTLQQDIQAIKLASKKELAELIENETGIVVDPHSIFDVQVKRLHAYKRQLLNALHIHSLYYRLKEDQSFQMTPRTFIFGAKAAPGYHYAKEVIRYINSLAKLINSDPDVSPYMKVVFLENYRVSLAEKIFPASDVSEQISTASYEASGTGNMKFMMNGALTIGTLDGANIEIRDEVEDPNIFIFGLTPQEVMNYKKYGGYSAYDQYSAQPELRRVIDGLVDGSLFPTGEFQAIYDSLLTYNDEYLILKDFLSYQQAQERIGRAYQDTEKWYKMVIMNIGKSGVFSSDRTIKEYANAIWNIKPVQI